MIIKKVRTRLRFSSAEAAPSTSYQHQGHLHPSQLDQTPVSMASVKEKELKVLTHELRLKLAPKQVHLFKW